MITSPCFGYYGTFSSPLLTYGQNTISPSSFDVVTTAPFLSFCGVLTSFFLFCSEELTLLIFRCTWRCELLLPCGALLFIGRRFHYGYFRFRVLSVERLYIEIVCYVTLCNQFCILSGLWEAGQFLCPCSSYVGLTASSASFLRRARLVVWFLRRTLFWLRKATLCSVFLTISTTLTENVAAVDV